jgi:predicted transcriptional regulator
VTTILSVRLDTDTKKWLEALAKRSRRSKSFLAAEAIAAFVEAEIWPLGQIQKGLTELDCRHWSPAQGCRRLAPFVGSKP